jgi:hypothetical protein
MVRVDPKVVLTACAMVGFGHLAAASGGPAPMPVRRSKVPTSQSTPARIGERAVDIIVADTGTDATFIRVHENEMPAGAVGRRINLEVPSRFIDLAQQGNRTVAFSVTGRQYAVDPNRIFSLDVRPAEPGAAFPPEVTRATRDLAVAITSLLLPNAPVIALHNNTGALLRWYASGPFQTCTHAVYVNPEMDAAAFVVVATRPLFEAIRNLGISVVWENRAGAFDDGSLLAYAQRHHLAYANIEAGQGASTESQLAVVRRIVPILQAAETARETH